MLLQCAPEFGITFGCSPRCFSVESTKWAHRSSEKPVDSSHSGMANLRRRSSHREAYQKLILRKGVYTQESDSVKGNSNDVLQVRLKPLLQCAFQSISLRSVRVKSMPSKVVMVRYAWRCFDQLCNDLFQTWDPGRRWAGYRRFHRPQLPSSSKLFSHGCCSTYVKQVDKD